MRFIIMLLLTFITLKAQNIYVTGSIGSKERDELFLFLKEINSEGPFYAKELVYLYSSTNEHILRFQKEQWVNDSIIERWLDTRPTSLYSRSLDNPSTNIKSIEYPEAEINQIQSRLKERVFSITSKESQKHERQVLLIGSYPSEFISGKSSVHYSWGNLRSAIGLYNKKKLPVDIVIVFTNKKWKNINSLTMPEIRDPSRNKRFVTMCTRTAQNQNGDKSVTPYYTFKFTCSPEDLPKVRMDIRFLNDGGSGTLDNLIPIENGLLVGKSSNVEIDSFSNGYCVRIPIPALFSGESGDICQADGNHNFQMRLKLVELDVELAQSQGYNLERIGEWVVVKFFSPPDGIMYYLSECECKR
jgi:hypothetical protein